jgi:L-fucose mutarotase
MLKTIDPLLGPDLLHALAAMGHGDEIAVVDANFPAAAIARRLIRVDGIDAPRLVAAILSLLPLDSFAEHPAAVMAVVGRPEAIPEPVAEFRRVVDAAEGRAVGIVRLDRFSFYERARAAFVVVATGDQRFYGNILLTKGVIGSEALMPAGQRA